MTERRKEDIKKALANIKKRSINAKVSPIAYDREVIHTQCAIDWQTLKDEVNSEGLNFDDFIL